MAENDLKKKIIQAITENKDPNQSNSNNQKKSLRSVIISSVAVTSCLVFLILFLNGLFSETTPTGPWAKISLPSPGTTTGTNVKITAETRNIEPGQYIWLAVDKPKLGLCWPKPLKLHPNTAFATSIHEGGPNEPYRVSIYAVNKTLNDQWEDWVNRNLLSGLPMPPKTRRLASVVLIKAETS